ncbi:ATP-binding protein [Streptomyces acidiscabies]|uniref:ATP-binding protein n=1 Tax=Streptomyces acidiscabies TaxID=42234 RepID=UPI00073E3047|nr:ATP-binding protein [Streptomyces acidiscabies]GAQ52321.1 hypothetical protein a10_02103 [Streptomyces acidiscabies]
MPDTVTFQIPKNRRHVPTARHRIQKTLADWGVDPDLSDAITLAANELVTNSVAHCKIPLARIEITLRLTPDTLHLTVADPDRDHLPHLTPVTLEDEGGRGLILVDRLASDWGHATGPYTKHVWATFTLHPARTCAPTDL